MVNKNLLAAFAIYLIGFLFIVWDVFGGLGCYPQYSIASYGGNIAPLIVMFLMLASTYQMFVRNPGLRKKIWLLGTVFQLIFMWFMWEDSLMVFSGAVLCAQGTNPVEVSPLLFPLLILMSIAYLIGLGYLALAKKDQPRKKNIEG
jgi:hypothetical protein